jgi:hypothetical protein
MIIKRGDAQPINIIEFEDINIDKETKEKLNHLKDELVTKSDEKCNQDRNVQ